MTIIEDFIQARQAFHAEMAALSEKGEDTSSYIWNFEVAHMRDFEEAYAPEEREALWAWFRRR